MSHHAPPWPKPPPSELRPGPDETLDRLAGDWWVFQLACGHRYATDDVVLAWTALRARPAARTVLDLGAGVGSVGLMTLLCLGPEAQLSAVEIQPASAALMRKTVAYNGLADHVRVAEMDLRCAELGRFDVVVANPPYLPEGSATAARHPQSAAARLERHGDVFDYARSAARHLAEGGRFVFCHAQGDPRPPAAIEAAGLSLVETRVVRFHDAPAQSLVMYVASGELGAPIRRREELLVRRGRALTEEYRAVRRELWIEA